MHCVVDVFQGSSVDLASDQDSLLCGEVSPFEVTSYFLGGFISGGIVNDD